MRLFRRGFLRLLPAAVLAAALLLPAGAAAAGLSLSTRFPGITVKPGQSVFMSLDISRDISGPVDLSVVQVPQGWEAPALRGGGFDVSRVWVAAGRGESVDLNFRVPASAQEGLYTLAIRAEAGGVTSTLPLVLKVDQAKKAGARLSTQYPSLEGQARSTFTFRVDLANDSPAQQMFALAAKAPEGWQVVFHPSFDSKRIATLPVDAGSTQGIDVEIQVPERAAAGQYTVQVGAAAGAGNLAATQDLQISVLGRMDISLSTPSGRLNAEATAGQESGLALVVANKGTSPLENISLYASAPPNWSVTFQPDKVDALGPGETKQVQALLKPDGKAIAGDYAVSITAAARGAASTADFRVAVQTSTLWGIVGLALVALVVGGVAWTFRTYGRR